MLGNLGPPWPALAALAAAGVVGAIAGVIIGLPALRLRTFYFAMTTLGFATIVTQIALAWQSVTGGGTGVPGPVLPNPFSTGRGFYFFCLVVRRTVHLDDAEHRAQSFRPFSGRDPRRGSRRRGDRNIQSGPADCGVPVQRRGRGDRRRIVRHAAILHHAGCLHLRSSVLFFIAILIGGRGSIIGPLLGTILLTVLPEFAAPLVAWSTFLYAALLLVIVLVIPGGIADLLDFANRKPLESNRAIVPRPALLSELLNHGSAHQTISLTGVVLAFRRRTRDRWAGPGDQAGTGAWADRPERIGQDHDAERDQRIQRLEAGRIVFGSHDLAHRRAADPRRFRHRAYLPDTHG